MADAHEVARGLVRDQVAASAAVGCAARVGSTREFAAETGGATGTYFDLASLTKPMTALAIARSGMDRTAPLGRYLPHLAKCAAGQASLEDLLAHRAGLVDHVDLRSLRRDEALAVVADSLRPEARGAPSAPGAHAPLYSDLGYILAGEALARFAGEADAGRAIEALVVRPLGLGLEIATAVTLEAQGIDVVSLAAPTEHAEWRGGVVRGRVHDENAWVLTGAGGSGHAGMFGTIRGVLDFASRVALALDEDPALGWLVAPRPDGTLLAGFDGKSAEGSSAGDRMGARAFGHLGFTGTSFWIDPDERVVVAILTNRVHPSRENVAIRAARPRAHDALYARALALRGAHQG